MKFAFCLFKYFPYGGLGRDFLRIARKCCERGHEVDVYAMEWQAEFPSELSMNVFPGKGFTNHGRCASFVRQIAGRLQKGNYDAVVGFNRMPGLDSTTLPTVATRRTSEKSVPSGTV